MNKLITALLDCGFPPEHIHPQEPMSGHTTFRIGGKADIYVDAGSEREIKAALRAANQENVPVTVVGNGSNLLVCDTGIRGLVIHLGSRFSALTCRGNQITAEAGASIAVCAKMAQQSGLAGLAEVSGIPGTIAGGAMMNAGAYGAELGNVITRVDTLRLEDGKEQVYTADNLRFAYRTSTLMQDPVIITKVYMDLETGDPEQIRARMDELSAERRAKQPLDLPSAGSTFKRPAGYYAAKLIDECGLRGLQVGQAQVSTKHAGFVVNLGGATYADVHELMEQVQERVFDKTGIWLEPEVRILGR